MSISDTYAQCWNARTVIDTVFGQQLIGPAVDVQWLGADPALSWYTFFNLAFMLFFILLGQWKKESSRLNMKNFSILTWQVSVLMVAMSVTITGLTRLTLFWATLHSASEFQMIYAIMFTIRQKPLNRTFSTFFLTGAIIYFMTQLLLAMLIPLGDAYWIVIGMGAPIDTSAGIAWFICYRSGKVKFSPMIAFSLHILYIVLLFFNCFMVPWGRVPGLALNTFAIFFASMPADRHSWRFVEFFQTCCIKETGEQESEHTPLPQRKDSVSSKPEVREDSESDDATEELSDWSTR